MLLVLAGAQHQIQSFVYGDIVVVSSRRKTGKQYDATQLRVVACGWVWLGVAEPIIEASDNRENIRVNTSPGTESKSSDLSSQTYPSSNMHELLAQFRMRTGFTELYLMVYFNADSFTPYECSVHRYIGLQPSIAPLVIRATRYPLPKSARARDRWSKERYHYPHNPDLICQEIPDVGEKIPRPLCRPVPRLELSLQT